MSEGDLAGAVGLQRDCFPAPFPSEQLWSEDHLRAHVSVFPEGQFIAVAGHMVIGSASNCIVPDAAWTAHSNWNDTVGGPFIESHDPQGSTLYGLDVSVHPNWRGKGVMREMYKARFELVSKMELKRYGTAVRIPGYDAYQVRNPGASPEDYVRDVQLGTEADRTLTPMLRVGLRLTGVIRNYMEDQESHNAAAVLEWQT